MKSFLARATEQGADKPIEQMSEEELRAKLSLTIMKRDGLTEQVEQISMRLFQIEGEKINDPKFAELPPVEEQIMGLVVEMPTENGPEVDVLLTRSLSREDAIEQCFEENPTFKVVTIVTQAEVKFFANLFEQFKHGSALNA